MTEAQSPADDEPDYASGCGYTGRDFGATYNDSICIDGFLWDLDSCDEPGGGLTHGGDIPCPACSDIGDGPMTPADEAQSPPPTIQIGEGDAPETVKEWPLRTPERASLVAKMRELGRKYPPYMETAQDVAEGRACMIPSWIVLDLLSALASRPEQESGSFSQEAKIPTEGHEAAVVGKEGWGIDRTTGTDILTFNKCSVIEDEQAHYLLGLIAAPNPDAATLAREVMVAAPTIKGGWDTAYKIAERLTALYGQQAATPDASQVGIGAADEPKDRQQPPASAGGK